MAEALQPIFIDVEWIHDFESEPIRLSRSLTTSAMKFASWSFSAMAGSDMRTATSRRWELSLGNDLFRR